MGSRGVRHASTAKLAVAITDPPCQILGGLANAAVVSRDLARGGSQLEQERVRSEAETDAATTSGIGRMLGLAPAIEGQPVTRR